MKENPDMSEQLEMFTSTIGLGGHKTKVALDHPSVAVRHDAGDHVLFIGRVLRLTDLSVAPLLFQGGHYRMMGEVL